MAAAAVSTASSPKRKRGGLGRKKLPTKKRRKKESDDDESGNDSKSGAGAAVAASDTPLKLTIRRRMGKTYGSDSAAEHMILTELKKLGLDKHAIQNRFYYELTCDVKECPGCGRRALQLDIYLKKFDLAIEINGSQHRCEADFHRLAAASKGKEYDKAKAAEAFKRYQIHDRFKIEFCARNGIQLIIAEFGDANTDAVAMCEYVREEVKKNVKVQKYVERMGKRKERPAAAAAAGTSTELFVVPSAASYLCDDD